MPETGVPSALVVDDDETTAGLLRVLLEKAGYRVELAVLAGDFTGHGLVAAPGAMPVANAFGTLFESAAVAPTALEFA